jgi:N-acetylglucosamine-6-phosphate deacetylase
MEIIGRRYDTGELTRIEVTSGRVAQLRVVERDDAADSAAWIAPGFVDLQVNGYGGQEFSSSDLTAEKVARISESLAAFGVTSYCPTLTTESFEVLRHALRTIAKACASSADVDRQAIGIHLEGPYLSREDGPRGAHPLQHCRRPDWDEFQQLQEAADGRIRLHTMAVEFDEAPGFICRLVDSGVLVAIGHTAANAEQIRRAVDAGARMSTHLGNGAHVVMDPRNNYVWEQVAEDRLVAGLIADGHHLPPPVVKTIVRAKTPERCVLVSDMSGQAGQPPGRYRSDFCDVEILPSGKLVVAGQREILAGASCPIGDCVANAMHFADIDLATAVRMAVDHPARELGITPGVLEIGGRADLILFDLSAPTDEPGLARLNVRATLVGGEVVAGEVPG